MYDIMGKYYEQIKEEVGLKDAFENSDEEEEQTEAIFKKLRPQSKYKFSEVLQQQEKVSPKKLNKMLGPMGVIVREQQLQLPATLGAEDSIIGEML